jgi:hypothetical protein
LLKSNGGGGSSSRYLFNCLEAGEFRQCVPATDSGNSFARVMLNSTTKVGCHML